MRFPVQDNPTTNDLQPSMRTGCKRWRKKLCSEAEIKTDPAPNDSLLSRTYRPARRCLSKCCRSSAVRLADQVTAYRLQKTSPANALRQPGAFLQ